MRAARSSSDRMTNQLAGAPNTQPSPGAAGVIRLFRDPRRGLKRSDASPSRARVATPSAATVIRCQPPGPAATSPPISAATIDVRARRATIKVLHQERLTTPAHGYGAPLRSSWLSRARSRSLLPVRWRVAGGKRLSAPLVDDVAVDPTARICLRRQRLRAAAGHGRLL